MRCRAVAEEKREAGEKQGDVGERWGDTEKMQGQSQGEKQVEIVGTTQEETQGRGWERQGRGGERQGRPLKPAGLPSSSRHYSGKAPISEMIFTRYD